MQDWLDGDSGHVQGLVLTLMGHGYSRICTVILRSLLVALASFNCNNGKC
jgi:hypothetical protein